MAAGQPGPLRPDGRRLPRGRAQVGLPRHLRRQEARGRSGGRLLLNGKRLNLRGASIHEDDREEGGALSQGTRRLLVNRLREPRRHGHALALPAPPRLPRGVRPARGSSTGCTRRSTRFRTRSSDACCRRREPRGAADRAQQHEPRLDPHLVARQRAGRQPLGARHLRLAACRRYIRDASTAVREMDDTHLIGDRPPVAHRRAAHRPAFRYLDVLGVNEYFGWYDSYKADLVRPASTLSELGPLPRRAARARTPSCRS